MVAMIPSAASVTLNVLPRPHVLSALIVPHQVRQATANRQSDPGLRIPDI